MQNVHGRQERKLVLLNRYNQPIGPTNAIVTELGSFLGTLARNEKYDIPDSAKKWALEGNKNARRKYKNDLYEKHYKAYNNDDLRMFDSKRMNPHTVGKTSFAVIRNNFRRKATMSCQIKNSLWLQDQENLVKYTRTPMKIQLAEMEKLQSQQSEDANQSFDAFTAVMGDEHPGSLRLYGRGVTKSTLKRKELEEGMHQRMAEKLEQQKVTIHQEVIDYILGRLNHMYPGLQLNAAMLASLGAQSP
ncbi:hypothetical protein H5410_021392 [Solanum commersonii]|uniref:Uncharacterized protein n=1 Tax=Solanum commersonii TaxID=4109 RepID=A0A9J5ZDV3_SOLCO|nr:hypothetical protein H5410_021392 [Solanum commersonii]